MRIIKNIIPNKESLKEKMIRSLRGWTLRFVVNVLIPFTGFAQA